jgi:glycosyltransferase involved in cell wall biosynthesis
MPDGQFGADRTHRTLTVVNVAAQLEPDAGCGAAEVVRALDLALVTAGHRSIVIAPAGSVVAGELVPVMPAGKGGPKERQAALRAAIGGVLREADIFHIHDPEFSAWQLPVGLPVLVTLHRPAASYDPDVLAHSRPGTWLNCISLAQQAACPRGAALVSPVPHGVDVDALGASLHAKRGFALMLGRIAPETGQHLGLAAAHIAGVPLLIAGAAAAAQGAGRAYFANEVRPLLDRCRRWLGPLDFARKRRLLSAARCVLMPNLAPETSALVAMEAAACGTPVIAFATAALEEIVQHGRTGFIVRDTAEMAAAIGQVNRIEPRQCRSTARARFGIERMTDAYLAHYQELVTVEA